MTNSLSEVTIASATSHSAVQSSTVATSSSENRGLEKQHSSSSSAPSAPPGQQQQQLPPNMAVELQSLPVPVAPHMGFALNLHEGPGRACYISHTTSSVSPFCGAQAGHASSMLANDAMLTAAMQPDSHNNQQQQQYNRSSSTSWQGLGGTMSPPSHSQGASGSYDSTAAAAAPAAPAGATAASDAAQLLSRSSSQHSNPPAAAASGDIYKASAAGEAAASGEGDGSSELPLLARELGVTVASFVRLFSADTDAELEQPVWMVVNLQGKIKGSYTAEKMLEFCRRGTLSAAQMVLGIDKNLPYVARQELAFYRPLGQLIVAVHAGARYTALTEVVVDVISANNLTPAHWSPLVNTGLDRTAAGDGGSSDLMSDLCSLNLDDESACGQGSSNLHSGSGSSGATSASGGSSTSDGRVVAAAAAARLRSALQRLCGVGHQGGQVAVGSKQPLWLYINHLGWCRGPFSGGKVMHAHLCGRLPRNTLVVAYDPELPACMISGDVGQWFRPLGALLDNVANGWTYNTVKWPDVVNRGAFIGSPGGWEPLVWLGPGSAPALAAADQLAPPATTAAAATGTAMPAAALRSSGSGSLMPRPAAVQFYSTGSTMQGAVPTYTTGGTMQGSGAVQPVYVGEGGTAVPLALPQQEMHWPPQQQQPPQPQQMLQAQSRVSHLYYPSDYQAGMMTNAPGAEGISRQTVLANPCVMAMVQQQQTSLQQQQQQQPRIVAMFPNSTPVPSWESGSFPASSSSNALPSTSLGSSSTATGHSSLAQHANSGTASPIISLAGTSGDSNSYSAGQYTAAAAVRAVDPSFAGAVAPAWWQQQQYYSQVVGTSGPFVAAMSSAELAGQQPSGAYMVMPNSNAPAMRPAAGFTNMSGYDVSSGPMVMPSCSLPNAATTSAGMMLLLQQQQQNNNSPIQQQQQAAAQQQQQCLLLDSRTFSNSLASAGSGPFFWQQQ